MLGNDIRFFFKKVITIQLYCIAPKYEYLLKIKMSLRNRCTAPQCTSKHKVAGKNCLCP